MAENVLPKPAPNAFNDFLRASAQALRAKDQPPADRPAWEKRRAALREAMFAAMGPVPEMPCALEPKELGVLKRAGYRVEKLIFQSRPDVWVTASAYVPETRSAKVPAVLVVHGHWPWARRDPVVQARCLGLVKLGFFVLAVDAFGAGERYTEPARGTYHGALYGATLWPAGQTLLGMQVYDNRRAVDYLLTRPEVDGQRLGVTGASGGGNQSMYAGALDERLKAVVPVCSVGTYQAYLQAACCVCEVLPGALRFAEEGDVLALVAPRALMVANATRDAFQFSVGEAEKSVARARHVFRLYDAEAKLKHAVFESGHDYSKAMREAMYGWMTRWLKDEGEGKPISEPDHTLEQPDDLRCFPDGKRPAGFLFPPSVAARAGSAMRAVAEARKPEHAEDWESTAVHLRRRLRKEVFGDFPPAASPSAQVGKPSTRAGIVTTGILLQPEPGIPLPLLLMDKEKTPGQRPVCVLLHLDGKNKAVVDPLCAALLEKGWAIAAPDLRATGETQPPSDTIAGAPDHNSAEHTIWLGRPLLGQWVFDVSCLLDWLALQPQFDKRGIAVVGLGQAGVVALCASALLDDRIQRTSAVNVLSSFLSEQAYAPGTHMGLLAPGILRAGDVPQLAALSAPRKLILAGAVSPTGTMLQGAAQAECFAFTKSIYKVCKAADSLHVLEDGRADQVVRLL